MISCRQSTRAGPHSRNPPGSSPPQRTPSAAHPPPPALLVLPGMGAGIWFSSEVTFEPQVSRRRQQKGRWCDAATGAAVEAGEPVCRATPLPRTFVERLLHPLRARGFYAPTSLCAHTRFLCTCQPLRARGFHAPSDVLRPSPAAPPPSAARPQNLASTQLVDTKTPNSEICMANGYSSMVFDQRIFVSFNP